MVDFDVRVPILLEAFSKETTTVGTAPAASRAGARSYVEFEDIGWVIPT